MKNIILDIEKLLKKYDYVIIPEFGGFVLQTQSARFDGNNIIPPTSTISFNPLLQELDGLLAIEVSRTKNINYREAVRFISNEVLYFKKTLKKGKQVQLGRLGRFSLDKEDKIIFTPNVNLSFMPINYGLNSRYTSKKEKSEEKESKVVISVKLPTRKKIMKYAAIIITVLGIGLLAPQTSSYHKEKGTFNIIDKFDNFWDFEFKQKTSIQLPPLTMPVLKTTQFVTQKTVKPKVKVDKTFEVVIASVKTQYEANRMKSIYRNDFKRIKILKNQNCFRVSAKGFKNKTNAHRFAQTIKRGYPQFQDTWVYEHQ